GPLEGGSCSAQLALAQLDGPGLTAIDAGRRRERDRRARDRGGDHRVAVVEDLHAGRRRDRLAITIVERDELSAAVVLGLAAAGGRPPVLAAVFQQQPAQHLALRIVAGRRAFVVPARQRTDAVVGLGPAP